MSIEINEYYKNQYLTCGNTYDNFVFCNFPRELVSCVEKSLSQNANECTSVVLRFDKQIEEGLSKTLDACADDFQRGVLARTYYIARFMRELLHKTNQTYRHHTVEGLDAGIESLLGGDFEGSKKFYLQAPYFSEIDNFIRYITVSYEGCKKVFKGMDSGVVHHAFYIRSAEAYVIGNGIGILS